MRGHTATAGSLTEQEWDGQLFRGARSLAVVLGWTSYHTLRSRGSKAGYPDRTVWRDRVIFVELKREGGKPSELQVETLTGLARAGAECYLWRPSDLDEIGQVLGTRPAWRDEWTPGSLWLPAGCRADEAQQLALGDAA